MAIAPTDSQFDFPPATAIVSPAHETVAPGPLDDIETVDVFGLPLARLDTQATLACVDRLIRSGDPGFFITANLHYARLSAGSEFLQSLNQRAAFLIADGMPLVWTSRRLKKPLPERVAGSDLVEFLCKRAALHGYRVFFLGGAKGVAAKAALRLKEKYPLLPVAGIEAPDFSEMTPEDHEALVARIRTTRPDILLAALGQPKGELWIDRHCQALGVPACVQVGASLDFVAGQARRAPRWMQRTGTEWLYRTLSEPRRLLPRYAKDALFLLRAMARRR